MSRKRKLTPAKPEPVQQQPPARITCEGCASLRRYPTSMCQNERSPNYRRPVDTYHLACDKHFPRGVKQPEAKPQPPEPPPMSRAKVAGEVPRPKHNRWALRNGVLYVSAREAKP